MPWTKANVNRIAELTAKQEAQLSVIRDKWHRIATSTEPVDSDGVVDGMQRFYVTMGFKKLKRKAFYRATALDAGVERGTFNHNKGTWDFSKTMHRSAWQTRCWLNRSYESPVLNLVERFMLRDVVRPPDLWDLVSFPERASDHRLSRVVYGQEDAPWLSIVDFFATIGGNEYCEKLSGLCQAVASCGFLWLKPDEVICGDRPIIAKYDDRGRPHCEDGPAIEYSDGVKVYALDGVTVPRKYVETPADQIDLTEILNEPNSELRRVVIKKFGFMRLLSTVRHRVVSKKHGNALLEFRFPKPANSSRWDSATPRLRVLHLKWQDKTGAKETVLPVPRLARQFGADAPSDVNDCEQVRRWTLGWPKEALAIAET